MIDDLGVALLLYQQMLDDIRFNGQRFSNVINTTPDNDEDYRKDMNIVETERDGSSLHHDKSGRAF